MNKPKHTPLPWETWSEKTIEEKNRHGQASYYTNSLVHKEETSRSYHICKLDFGYGSKEDNENADFIVRACNSHYELIEKAEKVMHEIYKWDYKDRDMIFGIDAKPLTELKQAIEKASLENKKDR